MGSDADDGDGLGIDPECPADDGRFAGIIVLPGGVADDRSHGGARDVIRIVKQAARLGLKTEGAEIIAGDEFAHDGARASGIAIAARDDGAVAEAGLHGRELFEFGDVLL